MTSKTANYAIRTTKGGDVCHITLGGGGGGGGINSMCGLLLFAAGSYYLEQEESVMYVRSSRQPS